MPDDQPDAVEAYLAAYLAASEHGREPPSLDALDDITRAEVEELLGLLARSPGDEENEESEEREGTELRPLAESGFAVRRGFVRAAPDVVVVGPAVRRAREGAGLTTADVARAMTDRGDTTDATAVAALEDSPAWRMRPRQARLLAAVLEHPLSDIEASAEPWPADPGSLSTLRQAGADVGVLDQDAVVRTDAGSYLGLVRCPGDAAVLDSRTYRLTAAALLNGPWSHLAGALLVAQRPPHLALPVDALDCVTRSHAPSGLSGFSRLADPAPIADALAAYDRAFSVAWSDPEPLDRPPAAPGRRTDDLADRMARLADQLSIQGRRARQPGKPPGYQAAAHWLRTSEPREVVALLEELAMSPLDVARERLGGVLSP